MCYICMSVSSSEQAVCGEKDAHIYVAVGENAKTQRFVEYEVRNQHEENADCVTTPVAAQNRTRDMHTLGGYKALGLPKGSELFLTIVVRGERRGIGTRFSERFLSPHKT